MYCIHIHILYHKYSLLLQFFIIIYFFPIPILYSILFIQQALVITAMF